MDKNDLKTLYTELKNIDFNDFIVTLWLVKRTLRNRQGYYKVSWVDTDEKLRKKLKNTVDGQIKSSGSVEEYEYITADQDNTALNVSVSETDFSKIHPEIQKGSNADKVKDIKELYNTWAYVIELKNRDQQILAFKKVPESWSVKKTTDLDSLIFKNTTLQVLDNKSVFKIDRTVDFIAYKSQLFILNKKSFEAGLNFRVGMEKNRDEILKEFDTLKIFDDTSIIKEKIGNNLKYLRKISSIKNNGYYKNPEFIAKLKEINIQESWGLEIDNDKIIVHEEKVDLILTLINNDRLKSLINEEVFDAVVKKLV